MVGSSRDGVRGRQFPLRRRGAVRRGAVRKKRPDRARSQPRVSANAGPERVSAPESIPGNSPDTPPLVVDPQFLKRSAEIADLLHERQRPLGLHGWSCEDFLGHFAPSRSGTDDPIGELSSVTKSGNQNDRLCAAHHIVAVCRQFVVAGGDEGRKAGIRVRDARTPNERSIRHSILIRLQESAAAAVLGAMDSDDVEVRNTIVLGLGVIAIRFVMRHDGRSATEASGSERRRSRAFECVEHGLKDADHRIRARCLELLPEFGIDRVSSAVNDVQALLADRNPEVQRLACDRLGWLGRDAIGAIDDLMRCAAADRVNEVRSSAAVALAKIFASGIRLPLANVDESLLADLINLLRDAGADGRALRQYLQGLIPDDSINPPPGNETVLSGGSLAPEHAAPRAHEQPDESELRGRSPVSGCPVSLGDPDSREVIVKGAKKRLRKAGYDVIRAIHDVFPKTLTKDELVDRSGHTDAVNILKRLAKKPDALGRLVQRSGEERLGYGLRDPDQPA